MRATTVVLGNPIKQHGQNDLHSIQRIGKNLIVQFSEMLTGQELGLMRGISPDRKHSLGGRT